MPSWDDLHSVWQLMGAYSLDVKETGTDNFGALSELPRANDLTFKTMDGVIS